MFARFKPFKAGWEFFLPKKNLPNISVVQKGVADPKKNNTALLPGSN